MENGICALVYGILIMAVVLELKCQPRLDFKGPHPILWYTIKDVFGNKTREFIEFKI